MFSIFNNTHNFFRVRYYNPNIYNFTYPGNAFWFNPLPLYSMQPYQPFYNIYSYHNKQNPNNIKEIENTSANDKVEFVNKTLNKIKNLYNHDLPMPSHIISYDANKHGKIKANRPGAFYVKEQDVLAVISGKQNLEYYVKELKENKSDNSIGSWYKKGLKGDFSQVEFINPKFQKNIINKLKLYLNAPEEFNNIEKEKLGKNIEKLMATNQLLNHKPLEVINDLYTKGKNYNIIMENNGKTIEEISKLPQSEQKQEFYKIVDILKNNKGDVYINIDKIYEKSQKFMICHEFAHFLYNKNNKTKNNNFNENEKKIASEVSEYSKKNPEEFVAEVYAGIITGAKYSSKVMKLYAKYNGPELP